MVKRILSLLLVAVMLFSLTACDVIDYKIATNLYAQEQYDEARVIFEKLGDYKDSAEMANQCNYKTAIEYMDNEDFDNAREIFDSLGDFEDSKELLREVSWEIVYDYLEGQEPFKVPVETSLTTIQAEKNKIFVGFLITFDDDLKVDARYAACFNKDGSVDTLGVSDSSFGNSTEYVEAIGYWDISNYEYGDIVEWEDINSQSSGFFEYNDEPMLLTTTEHAFATMVVVLEMMLEESETGVTVQDLGFYSYETPVGNNF